MKLPLKLQQENHLIRLEPMEFRVLFQSMSQALKATILTLLAFLFLVFIMNLLLFKMQLTNKCSALLGKLRRYPYGYRLVYFGLIIFIYFLLRFVRMIIATTAAARIIPITTRIIPIIPLASSIPRIWLI